jgi:hypothetical protein
MAAGARLPLRELLSPLYTQAPHSQRLRADALSVWERPGTGIGADINPTGLSQKLELHKLYGWAGPWEVTFSAGQSVYSDNNEGLLAPKSPTNNNQTDKAKDAVVLNLAYQNAFNLRSELQSDATTGA